MQGNTAPLPPSISGKCSFSVFVCRTYIDSKYEGRSRRTTAVAVRDAFGSINLRVQIFLTGDEFTYAPEKQLNGQSEVFYFTANENSEIITNCALTKAVSMLENKDMLICLPFV